MVQSGTHVVVYKSTIFFSITIYRLAKLLFRLLYYLRTPEGPEVSPTLNTSTVLYYTLGTVYNFNFTTVKCQCTTCTECSGHKTATVICRLQCRNFHQCIHLTVTLYTVTYPMEFYSRISTFN